MPIQCGSDFNISYDLRIMMTRKNFNVKIILKLQIYGCHEFKNTIRRISYIIEQQLSNIEREREREREKKKKKKKNGEVQLLDKGCFVNMTVSEAL